MKIVNINKILKAISHLTDEEKEELLRAMSEYEAYMLERSDDDSSTERSIPRD